MNQNCIYSSVHPEEFLQALKKGLPLVFLGLILGFSCQEWLKPDPFSFIGFLAFIGTFACLILGFKSYYQLKKADRYPTIVEWENGSLFIQGVERQEIEIFIKDIQSCEFANRVITLTLHDGKTVILRHFSERAAERLKLQIARYRAS